MNLIDSPIHQFINSSIYQFIILLIHQFNLFTSSTIKKIHKLPDLKFLEENTVSRPVHLSEQILVQNLAEELKQVHLHLEPGWG